jgi:hypothetical protein
MCCDLFWRSSYQMSEGMMELKVKGINRMEIRKIASRQ